MDMTECNHEDIICLNPYEIIRKYQCASCKEVMMCTCEQDIANRYFPHQIGVATELKTKQDVLVTLGFQDDICNSCRGLPEELHPKAEIYRAASKIKRYYWREILFETTRVFGEWAVRHDYSDWLEAQRKHPNKYETIEKEVLEEIKKSHAISPKYIYQEESQSKVLSEHNVIIIDLHAVYIKNDIGQSEISEDGDSFSPEEYAARYFEKLGYEVLFTESVPFHCLFGTYMWLLIQHYSDSRNKIIEFESRTAFDKGFVGEMITTLLPEDFGAKGYSKRISNAIMEHFDTVLPREKNELLWIFDYWLEPSEPVREYLWAHRKEAVNKARRLVEILPVEVIHKILRYLIDYYWKRYLGWPDLLVFKENEFMFVEVKSSKDKLSEDQKRWIKDNAVLLHLPFKIVNIHKKIVN